MWSPERQGDLSAGNKLTIGEAVTVKVSFSSQYIYKIYILIYLKMVEVNDTSSPKSPIHFADANEAGKIMYIQQPQGLYSACFGGLMGLRSRTLGAAGVVVDGRFRDVQEIQELGLPVGISPPPPACACSPK